MNHTFPYRTNFLAFLMAAGCTILLCSPAFDTTTAAANETSRILLDKGVALFEEGDAEQAAFLLEQAIIADPADAQTRFWLGRSYWQAEELVKAQRAFNQAVTIDPSYEIALYWSALADLKQDERDSAEDKYSTLQKLCGDCEEALELRATLDKPEEEPFLDLFSQSSGEDNEADDVEEENAATAEPPKDLQNPEEEGSGSSE